MGVGSVGAATDNIGADSVTVALGTIFLFGLTVFFLTIRLALFLRIPNHRHHDVDVA